MNTNGVPSGFSLSSQILSVEAVNIDTGARVRVSNLQTPANIVVPITGGAAFGASDVDTAQCVYQNADDGILDWSRDDCVGLPNPRPEVTCPLPPHKANSLSRVSIKLRSTCLIFYPLTLPRHFMSHFNCLFVTDSSRFLLGLTTCVTQSRANST
jgi:hypothetical protein